MTPKVIAAGHICLDVTPVFPQKGGELRELLTPGRLVQMGPADVHTGGSVRFRMGVFHTKTSKYSDRAS